MAIREASTIRISIHEVRDNATHYLAGAEILAMERQGRTIGFYIPTETRRDDGFREALDRLELTVSRITAETGLMEEELSRMFDL